MCVCVCVYYIDPRRVTLGLRRAAPGTLYISAHMHIHYIVTIAYIYINVCVCVYLYTISNPVETLSDFVERLQVTIARLLYL